MAWYYDLVVLAILALCVWNGMRKGVLIRTKFCKKGCTLTLV